MRSLPVANHDACKTSSRANDSKCMNFYLTLIKFKIIHKNQNPKKIVKNLKHPTNPKNFGFCNFMNFSMFQL